VAVVKTNRPKILGGGECRLSLTANAPGRCAGLEAWHMTIAGDRGSGRQLIARLVLDAGFEPVVGDPLRDANRFDVGAAVVTTSL
jgi:hypothetical protein